MSRPQQYKPVILVKHNSEDQLRFGNIGYSDTRADLNVGEKYFVLVDVYSFHTRYYTDNRHFYNSVCFSDVRKPVR